jgi:hypothetical protein
MKPRGFSRSLRGTTTPDSSCRNLDSARRRTDCQAHLPRRDLEEPGAISKYRPPLQATGCPMLRATQAAMPRFSSVGTHHFSPGARDEQGPLIVVCAGRHNPIDGPPPGRPGPRKRQATGTRQGRPAGQDWLPPKGARRPPRRGRTLGRAPIDPHLRSEGQKLVPPPKPRRSSKTMVCRTYLLGSPLAW